MLAKIDSWLARTVFWPIIIKVCQETGCTKWHFGRASGFAWCLCVIASQKSWSLFDMVLITIIAVSEVLSLGLHKDLPFWSAGWLRVMWWATFPLDAFVAVVLADDPHNWLRLAGNTFMLFSLYAACLPNIPPQDKKEPRRVRVKVTV